MKRILVMVVLSTIGFTRVNAQVDELAQLALNIEKLAQFKSILSDLKKGYEIVSKGYGTVKSLTEGNFSMHKVFLDGLMQVSPGVMKYRKIADIIAYQIYLVKEYKRAFRRFQDSNSFNVDEIIYLSKVYENLFNSSLKNLDELAMVITSGKLRMSDDERLAAIDKVFIEMEDKVAFLRHFNNQASMLVVQRQKEKKEILEMEAIYGIEK